MVVESGERGGKKRNRTKFTPEQKERMMGFAEKLGWKLQRKDEEDEVEKFCREVGISRQANVCDDWLSESVLWTALVDSLFSVHAFFTWALELSKIPFPYHCSSLCIVMLRRSPDYGCHPAYPDERSFY
ncbi:hypothetical protein DKX38_030199 [Salix brachista]|uniref:ZF-HD dimerization-type domain-containing protein n=1 Tax=Salix brachista TaxID=2182728 RepID=A0A5N5J167_9ROSI|nr:hypothetical protein DKX38_030199 [Salix brachista]